MTFQPSIDSVIAVVIALIGVGLMWWGAEKDCPLALRLGAVLLLVGSVWLIAPVVVSIS